MSKLDPSKMAALLALAREKKAEEAKQAMIARVTEKPKEFPFAPKPPTPVISNESASKLDLDLAKKLAEIREKKAVVVTTPATAAAPAKYIKLEGADLKAKLAAILEERKKQANPTKEEITNVATTNTIGDSSTRLSSGTSGIDSTNNPSSPVFTGNAVESAKNYEAASIKSPSYHTVDKYGNEIVYNDEQRKFVEISSRGESCVLIGAAGTGKTTCTQGGIQALIASGKVPSLQGHDHKHLPLGTPGVIIIAYTRRAVNNIKKVLPADLKENCITAHKLLEYGPVYYEVEDPETGITRKTMRFEPARDENNPLPPSIHTVFVEESSMMSLDLFAQISRALPHEVQWVFLGDIQQLLPVFGAPVLGFKMLEFPTIELTTVYRQALESPIIRLAHRILSGKPIKVAEFPDWNEKGKLTIHPWKKKLSAELAVMTLSAFFIKAYDSGIYNIDEDVILIPYNKACGTVELNKSIANHIARSTGNITFEVMAGFNKLYFSSGDKVLYDKEDAEIVEITYNPSYTGAKVQPESRTLDYWGHNPNLANEHYSNNFGTDDVDFLLDQVGTSEDRVAQASHNVVVKLLDSGQNVTLNKAAELNNLLHSYALTVHKAQGSEWRKVFLTLHQSHAKMLQRELLYTAVTRAREELYVICEPESFTKGIVSQRIKGNTLAEKAEYFKGKVNENEELLG